jgi:hypothetical protein
MPGSYISQYAYLLLWLAPALIYDVARRGAVHRAYVIGLALVSLTKKSVDSATLLTDNRT